MIHYLFQAFAPQVGSASRRGSPPAGRADGLPTLLHVVGQHSTDLGAAALTALLWLRARRVRQAHALGTGSGKELELTTGGLKVHHSVIVECHGHSYIPTDPVSY